jgi:hypothetical protein
VAKHTPKRNQATRRKRSRKPSPPPSDLLKKIQGQRGSLKDFSLPEIDRLATFLVTLSVADVQEIFRIYGISSENRIGLEYEIHMTREGHSIYERNKNLDDQINQLNTTIRRRIISKQAANSIINIISKTEHLASPTLILTISFLKEICNCIILDDYKIDIFDSLSNQYFIWPHTNASIPTKESIIFNKPLPINSVLKVRGYNVQLDGPTARQRWNILNYIFTELSAIIYLTKHPSDSHYGTSA